MTGLGYYLQLPFAQNALIAGTLIAVAAGLLSRFVVIRGAAFAVHGASELAFTGAAAGLLISNDPVAGALVGSVVVAAAMATLGNRARERDTAIGVILGFGLGLGVLLLSYYKGYTTEATNILFGDILGVSRAQVVLLVGIDIAVLVVITLIYRPLLFASLDEDLAEARGVPTNLIGQVFMLLLALTVAEAAQIVGTLLVLSLTITPAAAAQRLSVRPLVATVLAVVLAVGATDGGLLLNFEFPTKPATVFITFLSFGAYIVARLYGFARIAGGGRVAIAG